MPENPIKEVVKEAVAEETTATPAEGTKVASVAIEKVREDPVKENDLNQEPWWQSGVGIYGTGGILWALGAIAMQVSQHGNNYGEYDLNMMVTAVGALVGFAGVLYRRFWPGLRPMFWWWSS